MACSCSNATISCSEFCGCQDSCQNRWNLRDIDIYDCNESDDDSEIETMIFMTTLCSIYNATRPSLAKMKFWIFATWVKMLRFGCGPVKRVDHTR